jgi:hypothetical protein
MEYAAAIAWDTMRFDSKQFCRLTGGQPGLRKMTRKCACMDQKERAADGVRSWRAENPMQVIDSMCDHPSGSCRMD